MTAIAAPGRILVAFTLLGAGLVNLGAARSTLPRPQGLLALVAGVAELVVALLVLRGVVPRGARQAAAGWGVGVLAVVSVVGLALAVAPGGHFGAAAVAAATLQLAGAATIGATTRPRDAAPEPAADGTRRPHRGGPAMTLAGLFAGALLVATATTAGLTDTDAGAVAVPHGDHHLPDLPGLPEHHHGS
ncbi:hypothetical protein ACFQ8E_10590 [Isoptericola sp. NPDC056573]|uniref:hypothetical protein n=1 Tax=Isoptericola sp. NPDC056573 TaxID=3345868 RepID=UPI0036856669